MNKRNSKKKTITKLLSVLFILIMVCLVMYFLFNMVIGKNKIMQDFQNWSNNNAYLAAFLYLILTPIINIIPGISSVFFISLANMMFNDRTTEGMIKAGLLSSGGVLLSSILLFMLGRWFGKRLIGWIIGKDDYDKAEMIVTAGGKVCLPFVYLLPFFPDDTICFACGCTSMSFMYNLVNVLLFRTIGCFMISFFGTDYIAYSSFTAWQWVLFILFFIILMAVLFLVSKKYYAHLMKKKYGNLYTLTKGLKTEKD